LRQRLLFTVFPEGEGGKHAVTHYTVLENLGYVSRVALKLETGRTHQIRVHMQHIGHPVFGDPMYGGNRIVKGTVFTKYKRFVENCFALMPRQALHARVLGFTHPKTGERMRFEADPPADHLELIQRWRRYAGALGLEGIGEVEEQELANAPDLVLDPEIDVDLPDIEEGDEDGDQ
jgi:23S rRNA pseudouridine1911/1915/1917 synthase